MHPVLEILRNRDTHVFEPGEIVLKQGETTGRLYFLIEGAVDVLKDDTRVATASEPGAVFGEMAVLLGDAHTATVRATKQSAFAVVDNPAEFLEAHPQVCLHIGRLLARRLDSLNKYLVDVKEQFQGHDHIGMVDEVLETLMHRHPRNRQRPKDSTISNGE